MAVTSATVLSEVAKALEAMVGQGPTRVAMVARETRGWVAWARTVGRSSSRSAAVGVAAASGSVAEAPEAARSLKESQRRAAVVVAVMVQVEVAVQTPQKPVKSVVAVVGVLRSSPPVPGAFR